MLKVHVEVNVTLKNVTELPVDSKMVTLETCSCVSLRRARLVPEQQFHKRSSCSLGDVLVGLEHLCPSVWRSVLSDAGM